MEKKTFIYLDNNATTLLDPSVKKEMLSIHSPLNPSSFHSLGRSSFDLLHKARLFIASFLQVKSKEILFNSGATEGLNFLIRGFTSIFPSFPLISSTIEHPAVLQTLIDLQNKGATLYLLPPSSSGKIDTSSVEATIKSPSLLVFSAANTETGVKNCLRELSDLALRTNSPLIVDGVGLLGKEFFSIEKGIAAMAFSAHKFHGPLGVGFTYLCDRYTLPPLITGGGQEKGFRSGTENLPGILAMVKALSLVKSSLAFFSQKMKLLRDHFESRLTKELEDVFINGEGPRLVNTSNLSFMGVHGEDLLILLDQNHILASHGTACTSKSLEPSPVLLEMNLPRKRALCSIRFSFSRFNTLKEVNRVCDVLKNLVPQLKK